MRKHLSRVLLGVAIVALVGAVVAPAWAWVAGTNVSIHYRNSAFRGRVTSSRLACERARTVKVFRVRSGPDTLVGTDVTGRDGHYRVSEAAAHGRFYSKVTRRTFTSNGTTNTCRGAISETIRV